MFEHPEDVMQTAEETPKVSISPPKASPGENSTLPCFTTKDDPLRRIDKPVLCQVMDGEYKEHYNDVFAGIPFLPPCCDPCPTHLLEASNEAGGTRED